MLDWPPKVEAPYLRRAQVCQFGLVAVLAAYGLFEAYALIVEPLARLDVKLAQFPEVCMCCGHNSSTSYYSLANDSIYAVSLGSGRHPPMRWHGGCACLQSELLGDTVEQGGSFLWVCRASQTASLRSWMPARQTYLEIAQFADPAHCARIGVDLSYSSMEGGSSFAEKLRFIRTNTGPFDQFLGHAVYQRFRGINSDPGTNADPGEAADPGEWPTSSNDGPYITFEGQWFVNVQKVTEQGGSAWLLSIGWQPIVHRYIVLSPSSRAFLWLASMGGLFGALRGLWTFIFIQKNRDHEIAKIYDERTFRPLIPECFKKPAQQTNSSADDGAITGILNSPEAEVLGNLNDVQLRVQVANVADASSNYEEHSQRGLKASE
ncbi:unnamed protein product [Symbiodinium sp. CCMP2592]|nr:unnamed protein product [Symbiodinium sp. CCMP2592]